MKYLNKSFTVGMMANTRDPACEFCGQSVKVYHIYNKMYFCPACWERTKLLNKIKSAEKPDVPQMRGLGDMGKE